MDPCDIFCIDLDLFVIQIGVGSICCGKKQVYFVSFNQEDVQIKNI